MAISMSLLFQRLFEKVHIQCAHTAAHQIIYYASTINTSIYILFILKFVPLDNNKIEFTNLDKIKQAILTICARIRINLEQFDRSNF